MGVRVGREKLVSSACESPHLSRKREHLLPEVCAPQLRGCRLSLRASPCAAWRPRRSGVAARVCVRLRGLCRRHRDANLQQRRRRRANFRNTQRGMRRRRTGSVSLLASRDSSARALSPAQTAPDARERACERRLRSEWRKGQRGKERERAGLVKRAWRRTHKCEASPAAAKGVAASRQQAAPAALGARAPAAQSASREPRTIRRRRMRSVRHRCTRAGTAKRQEEVSGTRQRKEDAAHLLSLTCAVRRFLPTTSKAAKEKECGRAGLRALAPEATRARRSRNQARTPARALLLQRPALAPPRQGPRICGRTMLAPPQEMTSRAHWHRRLAGSWLRQLLHPVCRRRARRRLGAPAPTS